MAASHFLIHRSSERSQFYRDAPPALWSEEIGSWMISDHEIVLSVLKDRSFEAIDFKTETQKLSARFGIDFRATESFLDYVPLGQEGSGHSALRRKMALAIAQNAAAAIEAFDEFLAKNVAPAFAVERTFDIAAELFYPAISQLTSGLSGICVEQKEGAVSPTLIFDRMLSINRRKAVDGQIRKLLEGNARDLAPDEAAMHAAVVVVGSDSILGSISESFVHEIRANPGRRMSEIAWSEKIPVTAVPYVDRIASRSCEIGGSHIGAGQRVRLYLDSFASGGLPELDFYFGAGRHVCLGKAVSVQAWRSLVAALSGIDRLIEVKDIRYRRPDFLFNFPELVEIRVTNE